jgi:hypothetical protein
VKIAEILAVKSPENEVAVFLIVRNETQRREIGREFLYWDYTVWWVSADDTLGAARADHGGMRFRLHLIDHLAVTEEGHNYIFYHVLENEVLVVIAHDQYV